MKSRTVSINSAKNEDNEKIQQAVININKSVMYNLFLTSPPIFQSTHSGTELQFNLSFILGDIKKKRKKDGERSNSTGKIRPPKHYPLSERQQLALLAKMTAEEEKGIFTLNYYFPCSKHYALLERQQLALFAKIAAE